MAATAAGLGAVVAAAIAAAAVGRFQLAPAARHGRRHPQGPGAAEEPHPGGFGSYKGIVLVVLLGLVIWLVTGFFRVQPNQQAIQLVFGKPYGKPVEPGLHYNLPGPINVVVVNVQDQRRVVIGSRVAARTARRPTLARRAAPDLDREPDADRRREHRRHRVRRAVADQGRLQVRLRRA